jgi:hypothetical protein
MRQFLVISIVALAFLASASAALASANFTGTVYRGGVTQAGASVYVEQTSNANGPWTTVQTCTSTSNGTYNCGNHATNYWYRWYGVYIPNCFEYWVLTGSRWVSDQNGALETLDLNNVTRICSAPN